jgi:hypothetical protein
MEPIPFGATSQIAVPIGNLSRGKLEEIPGDLLSDLLDGVFGAVYGGL